MNEDKLNTIARNILDSEQFMWLMVGSNYEQMHLNDLREVFKLYIDEGGGYGKRSGLQPG